MSWIQRPETWNWKGRVWWPLFGAWNVLFPIWRHIIYWLAHWFAHCLTGASFHKPRHVSFFTYASCLLQSSWPTPPSYPEFLRKSASGLWSLLLCSKPPTVPRVQNCWARTEEHLWRLSFDQDQLRRSKNQEDEYLIWRWLADADSFRFSPCSYWRWLLLLLFWSVPVSM